MNTHVTLFASPRRRGTLTVREGEIALLVAHGLTNGEIGAELGISSGTVASYLHMIFIKLKLKRRSQLATLVGVTYAQKQLAARGE